ncbi:MAG: diguanylate cyclase [Methylococcaceae bacterium]|nr:MAG: diguanylate cyclase [Methylococcaceae bacterium]
MNPSPKRDKPVILIVDDVPTNIKILADALCHDYQIKVDSDGREALVTAHNAPQPDLILLDIMMPDMDGYEVLRRLKNDPATAKIPVIFVTAKSAESDEEYGLNLGAVDYIAKPYSIPITKARIRNHIALKQQADMLEALSLIDPLTHIPNRRSLDANLDVEWKRAVREQQPLSLLMIDIDHFKRYNDHYGHGAGDDCLRRVAEALSEGVFRPGDTVARYGGEEFVILLPQTARQPAGRIAEQLRRRILDLNLPHAYSSAGASISISIGCATGGADTGIASAIELLQAADAMLYQAKAQGRNRVVAA